MSARPTAKAAIERLHALSGGDQMVRKAAARLLATLDPTEVTELLHELIALTRMGDEHARCVLPAFTRALEMEESSIPYAAEFLRVAALMEQKDVEDLLRSGAPMREYDLDAARRADAKLFSQSLGYLKQKARITTNPDELARLAVASDPSVVRNVLVNPRTTEALVVRIAARRPARPEPLTEIWKSPKWSVNAAVRRSLVFNPYLPPQVASKIVPLLAVPDLELLHAAASLHPLLREQAARLLGLPRPRRVPPALADETTGERS
jgi:hypothetical protein